MAKEKKNGFKTIETSYEDLDKQIQEHRKNNLKIVLRIVLLVAVVVLAVELMFALRRYGSYEVTNSVERNSNSATQYQMFGNYLLEYSNDGISCMSSGRQIVWNQSFEMVSPKVVVCEGYLAVYDGGGTQLYILTEAGLQKSIETTSPIQTVCIAEQGTVAVLMREGLESLVKLFDKKGNELANGKFYGDKGGFPIDIALSYDGTKLAVDMVDVSQGSVSTTISFYNFGSVGQSEIDNNVGMYTFEGIMAPEIDYISSSRMIGVGTGRIFVFEGNQKPELVREISVEQEVLSFFYNEKYVGIVYDNVEEEALWHIKVMDLRGTTVMENDISIAYDNIEFLSNNEICVTSENSCELFTIHSIKKFNYTFDKDLYKVLAGDTKQNYTFIFKGTIEEVKLK